MCIRDRYMGNSIKQVFAHMPKISTIYLIVTALLTQTIILQSVSASSASVKIPKFNIVKTPSIEQDYQTLYFTLSKDNSPRVLEHPIKGDTVCARATYRPTLNQTGWDSLVVQSFKECDRFIQAWGAGYLEGFLTYRQILNLKDNFYATFQEGDIEMLNKRYTKIEENLQQKISQMHLSKISQESQTMWIQVALIRAQMEGMLHGHNARNLVNLTIEDFYLLNDNGQADELLTIIQYVKEQLLKNAKNPKDVNEYDYILAKKLLQRHRRVIRHRADETEEKKSHIEDLKRRYNVSTFEDVWAKLLRKSHCSVIVKLVRGEDGKIQDLIAAHNTWDDFSKMIRIYKQYEFVWGDNGEVSDIVFSSYAGCISSTDEFYEVNGKFFLTETTLNVLDESIYNIATKTSLKMLDCMRGMAANRLAKDAKDWVKWFSKGYTGRYSSQWMIIDVEKAKKSVGKDELEKGTFYVYEQIPTSSTYKDTSLYLNNHGYWGSYNIPFFQKIASQAGYECTEIEDWREPREALIAAAQKTISTVDDMKRVIQSNDPIESQYQPDQIAPRFDLVGAYSNPKFGAVDSKVVNIELMEKNSCQAIGGPTHSQGIAPFEWSIYFNEKHYGQPDLWNFDWVLVSRESLENGLVQESEQQ
eukprot:TRINITY_DN332_c0_g1_i2.p1 TRINITY_DN332_c0_g1~~TRINITY_DN332_c0_g1_i2.p1  ORF type:complete len:642 (+),score=76.63 TRINITY_DN332_c0_g1_i2:66-1991(+)